MICTIFFKLQDVETENNHLGPDRSKKTCLNHTAVTLFDSVFSCISVQLFGDTPTESQKRKFDSKDT